jgi:uncharacterized membrane protein
MLRSPSLLARALEPLISALWLFFLVWSVVVAVLWLGGEKAVAGIGNEGLRAAATVIIKTSDTLWLLLAAANLYLHLAERHGLPRARIVALVIAIGAGGIAACSAATGYPLGSVFYTTRLGMKLGSVPLGWPLLWFVIVIGGRELAAQLFPRVSHGALAVITGGFAVLTDLSLEPIATKFRLFWFWYASGTHLPSPPLWRNYAVWFVATSALAWVIREQKVVSARSPSWRPALVLVVINLLLIEGHLRAAFSQ